MRVLIVSATVVAAAAATAQSGPESLTALRRALGGERAIASIASIHIKARITADSLGRGNSESFIVLPDRFAQQTDTIERGLASRSWSRTKAQDYDPVIERERQTTVQGDTGQLDIPHHAYLGFSGLTALTDGAFRPLPEAPRAEAEIKICRAARRAFNRIAIPLLGGGDRLTLVDGRDANLIFRDDEGGEWRLTLDANGRPATLRWNASPDLAIHATPNAPQWVSTFSDFRPVPGGLVWPYKIVTTFDERPYEELTVRGYDVNGKISAKVFKR